MVGLEVTRVAKGKMLVCGLGGRPTVDMAVHEGATNITILDHDSVELSNLIRLTYAVRADVDSFKTDVLAAHARAINPDLNITALRHRITPNFDLALLRLHEYDIVVLEATGGS
jgi:adenylyltransferase/sulfurtransferase